MLFYRLNNIFSIIFVLGIMFISLILIVFGILCLFNNSANVLYKRIKDIIKRK